MLEFWLEFCQQQATWFLWSFEGAGPGMQPACSPGTASLQLTTVGSGLLGGGVVAALVAWRLNLTAWEAVQVSCQVLLFALGCWLLPKDNISHGPTKQLVTAVGVTFAAIRLINYVRVATMAEPPPQYATLFEHSAFAYAILGLYMAECMFMQLLLNRAVPGWACTFIGFMQASIWSYIEFRYTSHRTISRWSMLRLLLMPQVGMFAPYYMLTHKRTRQAINALARPNQQPDTKQQLFKPLQAANKQGDHQGSSFSDGSSSANGADMHVCLGRSSKAADALGAQGYSVGGKHHGPLRCSSASQSRVADSPEPQDALLVHSVSSAKGEPAAISSQADTARGTGRTAANATGLMARTPYKSRWRAAHTVCVKLGTDLPCSQLSADMAQQLQSALRTSIGQATSLSISNVAVRHGCICITMKVVEEQAASEPLSSSTSLQVDAVAQALLPELQSMLSTAGGTVAVQRAMVQVDDDLIVSVWRQDKQDWELQRQPSSVSSQSEEPRPWLGLATASAVQNARPSSSMALPSCPRHVTVLAEVQLWGVSKVADVEGWTPPSQQHSTGSEWAASVQLRGDLTPLRILARSGGIYLPTEVVRLARGGSRDDFVTAQVLVQLHEHQLVRHHEGGSPSTLLLMDLELWQNEVLLSSSPLLSLPGAAAGGFPAATAWWWGAADRTVAAATQEVQLFAEQCTAAAAEEDASTAIHTYVQYVQDLAIWLCHVRRTAHAAHICHQAPAHHTDKSQADWLLQPTLAPKALKLLGIQLVQYAGQIGLHNIKRMVQEQTRNVVTPAQCACSVRRSWLTAGVRAAVLGYPCRHDEQLYKQKLAAMNLSGVLVVSSVASVLIAGAYAARATPAIVAWPDIFTIMLSGSWAIMHLTAAVGTLLRARSMQADTTAPGKFFWTLHLVKYCYLWRALVWFALSVKPTAAFYTLFDSSTSWLPLQSMLAVTEQIQAVTTLPAPFMMLIVLGVELPTILLVAPARMLFVPLVVIARVLLDAYIRTRLAQPSQTSRLQDSSRRHHVKRE